jgi:hypothetical protein
MALSGGWERILDRPGRIENAKTRKGEDANRDEAMASQSTCGGVRRWVWLDRVVVAACALAVYVATLAPTISYGDSPELTAAAWLLGVAHPTGYPLYMLLGHGFAKLIPFGSVAYRMNLLSALAMTAGLVLFYDVARRVSGRRLPSLAATLLLAFTPGLWSQALIAEVYAFHVALSAAVLLAGIQWDRRGDRRWLWLTAFLFGMGLTHHLMIVLLAPGLLYLGVTSRQRTSLARELPRLALCCAAPLSLYLYLPWAAFRDGPLNWGDPRSWDNFLAHITGRQYRDLMFSFTPAQLLERFGQYGGYLSSQFGLPVVVLGLLGLYRLARAQARWAVGTALLYAANLAYALNYRIYDVEVYFIPSNLVFALWVATGLSWVLRACRRKYARRVRDGRTGGTRPSVSPRPRVSASPRPPSTRLAWAACALLPAMLLGSHWDRVSQQDNWRPLEYGRGYLASLEPNALAVAGGDDLFFPLLYTKFVEGRRPDVTLLSYNDALSPERHRLIERLGSRNLRARPPACSREHQERGEMDPCYLRDLLAANVGRRPVYLVGPETTMAWPIMRGTLKRYERVTATNLPGWRLYTVGPSLEPSGSPRQVARFTFGDTARLVGYDTEPFAREGVTMLRVRYYWELLKPAPKQGLKVWVLFTDAEGNYRRLPNGEPRFHNIHPLGQGRPLPRHGFPRTICETVDVVVPPDEVNRSQRLRIALSSGDHFLSPIELPGERFADAGSVGTHVMAADARIIAAPSGPGG